MNDIDDIVSVANSSTQNKSFDKNAWMKKNKKKEKVLMI